MLFRLCRRISELLLEAERIGRIHARRTKELLYCRRTVEGRDRRVRICRVRNARRVAEVAVAHAHLRPRARPYGAAAVILLAEVIARDAHRLCDAAKGEVPILRMYREVRFIEAHMPQSTALGDVRLRIDALGACRACHDFEVRIRIESCIDADAQALLEAMLGFFKIVLIAARDGR